MPYSGNPFAKMPTVPLSAEILDVALRRAMKAATILPKRPIDRAKVRESLRIKVVEQVCSRKLNALILRTPRLEKLHPFYRDITDLMVGVSALKRALGRVNSARRLVSKLASEYLTKLRKARSPREAAALRRSFTGRVASILEELNESLELLAKARRELSRLPDVDAEGITVVVAGAPNVGKSSFVRCVSSGKPLVAAYPFTTKDISVGHLEIDGLRVQVIDTPGLLDRPLSKRGKVELKAISALRHLAKVIVFLVDPSETSGYSLRDQISVYREVSATLQAPCIVALSKVDLASEERIKEACALLNLNEPPLRIRADACVNTMEVLKKALQALGVNRATRLKPAG